MGYIYLASPYSAPTLQQRVDLFMMAQDASIHLIKSGRPVYSPIVHWHHIAEMVDLPKDFEFWKAQNDALLSGAESIVVLLMSGWKESKGVRYELQLARKLDLRCYTMARIEGGFMLSEQKFEHWTPESLHG